MNSTMVTSMPAAIVTTRSDTIVSAKMRMSVATASFDAVRHGCVKLAPTRHAADHVQQNGRDDGHGDKRRVGHEEREHDHQRQSMHHAGDGRTAAGLHVGDSARDGARGRDARREPHGNSERHELDNSAKLEGPQQDKRHARDDGGRDEPLHAVDGHNGRHDSGERRPWTQISARGCRPEAR